MQMGFCGIYPQGGFKDPFEATDVSRRKRAGIGLNNAPTDAGGYERVLESALI